MKEVLPRAKATMPAELRKPLLARAKEYDRRLKENEEAFETEKKEYEEEATKKERKDNKAVLGKEREESMGSKPKLSGDGVGSGTAAEPLPPAQPTPASVSA